MKLYLKLSTKDHKRCQIHCYSLTEQMKLSRCYRDINYILTL